MAESIGVLVIGHGAVHASHHHHLQCHDQRLRKGWQVARGAPRARQPKKQVTVRRPRAGWALTSKIGGAATLFLVTIVKLGQI